MLNTPSHSNRCQTVRTVAFMMISVTGLHIVPMTTRVFSTRVPSIRLRHVLLVRLYPRVAYPWPVSITPLLSYMLQVTERFGRIFSSTVVLFSIDTTYAKCDSSHIHATFNLYNYNSSSFNIITCEYAKFIKEKI